MTPEQDQLVIDNRPLVGYVLRGLHKTYLQPDQLEDLYLEGLCALCLAAQHFDPNRGCAFSSYAVPYIRGMMQRYAQSKIPLIRKPDPLRQTIIKIYAANLEDADAETIQQQLGLPMADVKRALQDIWTGNPVSLEDTADNLDQATFGDIVPDPDIDIEQQYIIKSFIQSLRPQARLVTQMLLAGYLQADVAQLLGVSRQRVSQIYQQVLQQAETWR